MIASLKQLRIEILVLQGHLPDNGRNNEDIESSVLHLFFTFADNFQLYANRYCKTGGYSDREIANVLFKEEFKNKQAFRNYLVVCINSANEYIQHLRNGMNNENIKQYKEVLNTLIIDIENLASNTEPVLAKNEELNIRSGRRPWQHPKEVYDAARMLFNIEIHDSIEQLYMRDIRPSTIFLLRQSIEIYGKNVIGLKGVQNKDGSISKKHTHIAWDFILFETSKAERDIELPFDPIVIDKVYKWSNSYVHTTYYPDCYIVFAAIQLIRPLFIPSTSPIRTFDGKQSTRLHIAAVKLNNYSSIQKTFTKYINRHSLQKSLRHKLLVKLKLKKESNSYIPIWEDLNNVMAYIVSL